MVSPKVAYKGLREELRALLFAGDFLNSRSGLVSCDLPGLPPCTWTISRKVFQLPAWIFISAFSAAFLLSHGLHQSCSHPTTPGQMVCFPEESHGPPLARSLNWVTADQRAPLDIWHTQPKCPREQHLELTWGSVLQSQDHGYFKKILSRAHLRGFFHGVELNWIYIILFLG